VRDIHYDPLRARAAYLGASLRDRLHAEYDVVASTIVQSAGDAVFVPAGAPHQVNNITLFRNSLIFESDLNLKFVSK